MGGCTSAKLLWSEARRLEDSSFRMWWSTRKVRRASSVLTSCSCANRSVNSIGQSLGKSTLATLAKRIATCIANCRRQSFSAGAMLTQPVCKAGSDGVPWSLPEE